MEFIKANEIKIRNFLSNTQEAYKVPLYQRPYAWKEDQWLELYEDINRTGDSEIHFLGSIVVVPQGPHQVGINYFEVVDGQQRIATLLIMLAVIRDILKENGSSEFAKYLDETFLFAKDFQRDKSILIPKLQLGRLDSDVFTNILEGKKIEKTSHLAFKCYDFFLEKIRILEKNALQDLANKILNKIAIVHINALNYLNAFRLFETLNDRGLELSAIDLIKNFLLMNVSTNESIFNSVIDEWNEMYEKVRDKDPIKFFRRYFLATYSGKVSERKLYEQIRFKSEKEGWDTSKISNFVKLLNRSATIYNGIVNASFNSEKINRKIHEFHLVEVSPSYSLLLKIMPLYDQGILTEDDVLVILEMIESFHIRWGICGQSTSELDDIYNQMCSALDGSTDRHQILDIIKQHFDERIKPLTDIIFQQRFENSNFRANESRTKYILWKLSEPTGETLLNISEITTEHILPQKLSDEWFTYLRVETGKTNEEISRLHEELLNRIGNLTLIKGRWNIKMSNRLFNEKVEDYKNSEISITKQLADQAKWTFDHITTRSRNLSELAVKKIWNWKQISHQNKI